MLGLSQRRLRRSTVGGEVLMRAARVRAFGSLSDVMVEEVPDPIPEGDQIRVRVAAAALNPLDYKVALTGHRGVRELPLTLGFDAVGIVDAIGPAVKSIGIGDRVCAMADIMAPGTAADLVLVRERNVAKVPTNVADNEAAGLPLAALTALQAWDAAGLEKGQSVLVHGGAGGVGHIAIQLAKLRGAIVYATASARHLDLLEDLGADHPIDYHSTSPSKFAGLVDVVLDTRGGEVASASLQAMRPGGTLVSIVGFTPTPEEAREAITVVRMLVEPRSDELANLVSLVADVRLRVLVEAVVPLERTVEALEALYAGHTVGKRILKVS
jgi:NADPH:quinone reductase-like Zn-dependent oxidoreductase